MRIAVCDDRERDRKWLADFLNAALLAAWEKAPFAVCFLDIFLEGISGVAAARRIRARDEGAAIVFTTSSPDYMAEGFEVGGGPLSRQAVHAGSGTNCAGARIAAGPVTHILCAESQDWLVRCAHGGTARFERESTLCRASVLLHLPGALPGGGTFEENGHD